MITQQASSQPTQPTHKQNIQTLLKIFFDPSSQPPPTQTLTTIHKNHPTYLPSNPNLPLLNSQPHPLIHHHHHHPNPNPNTSFLYILIVLACTILFVFFLWDLREEYGRAGRELEVVRKDCLRQFDQNQCSSPVEILVEDCRKWRECFLDDHGVRLTVVFARVFTRLLRTFVEEMGLICLLAVLAIIGFYFWGTNRNPTPPIQIQTHPKTH